MPEKTKKVTSDEKAVLAKIDSWPAAQGWPTDCTKRPNAARRGG